MPRLVQWAYGRLRNSPWLLLFDRREWGAGLETVVGGGVYVLSRGQGGEMSCVNLCQSQRTCVNARVEWRKGGKGSSSERDTSTSQSRGRASRMWDGMDGGVPGCLNSRANP